MVEIVNLPCSCVVSAAYDAAVAILDRIPKEVLDYFIKGQHINTPTKEDQR